MALAWVIMLLNDVATLSEENSKNDQWFTGDAASSGKCRDPNIFQIAYLILNIFLCCRFIESPKSNGHLGLYVKQSAELKRAKKKVDNLESKRNKAKLTLAIVDQLKADLVAAEQAQDTSYVAAAQAQSDVAAVGTQLDKALRELIALREVICGPIYKVGLQ